MEVAQKYPQKTVPSSKKFNMQIVKQNLEFLSIFCFRNDAKQLCPQLNQKI